MNRIRILAVVAVLAAGTLTLAQTPTPPPAPPAVIMQVPPGYVLTPAQQTFQTQALGWWQVGQNLWPIVGPTVLAVIAWIVAKLQSLEKRADRSAANTGSIQQQVNALSMASTPPGTTVVAVAPVPAAPTTPPDDKTGAGPNVVALVAFLVALGVVWLAGCTTTGSNPAANARNAGLNAAGRAVLMDAGRILTTAAANALLSTVQAEATGQRVDFLQAAAAGAWSQATATTTSTLISDAVMAYSAGKAAQTAKAASAAATVALQNGQKPAQVADAIAALISTGAGAPPAR